ncbi:hypothetical protein ACFFSW_17770 [Saccharothrix longispora]|uniref:Uncharacterized protein n=1 Tax=Saccharothrix longispora TaxID=33920 RepID=A0ABU1PSF9_9PSEU|nr:hypothetical protein [Saccharothrix longispora]MDR6593575.1 hypothetical protein [Saccharothrix longispora]
MASAVDKAIATLTSQPTVPRTEADTLVTHALPSLAALCRVGAVQDWFGLPTESTEQWLEWWN